MATTRRKPRRPDKAEAITLCSITATEAGYNPIRFTILQLIEPSGLSFRWVKGKNSTVGVLHWNTTTAPTDSAAKMRDHIADWRKHKVFQSITGMEQCKLRWPITERSECKKRVRRDDPDLIIKLAESISADPTVLGAHRSPDNKSLYIEVIHEDSMKRVAKKLTSIEHKWKLEHSSNTSGVQQGPNTGTITHGEESTAQAGARSTSYAAAVLKSVLKHKGDPAMVMREQKKKQLNKKHHSEENRNRDASENHKSADSSTKTNEASTHKLTKHETDALRVLLTLAKVTGAANSMWESLTQVEKITATKNLKRKKLIAMATALGIEGLRATQQKSTADDPDATTPQHLLLPQQTETSTHAPIQACPQDTSNDDGDSVADVIMEETENMVETSAHTPPTAEKAAQPIHETTQVLTTTITQNLADHTTTQPTAAVTLEAPHTPDITLDAAIIALQDPNSHKESNDQPPITTKNTNTEPTTVAQTEETTTHTAEELNLDPPLFDRTPTQTENTANEPTCTQNLP